MSSHHVFLAVKRAPVHYQVDPDTGELGAVLSAGGTANVVAEQAGLMDVTLVASATSDDDRRAAELHPDGLTVDFTVDSPVKLHLIRHAPEVFEDVQYAFQSDLMWAAFNSGWDTWTTPSFDASTRRSWDHFMQFTDDFAAKMLEMSSDTAEPIFLLHDYQMICLPPLLREHRPASRILLFVHVPWPGADYWRITPRYMRTTVIERMLRSDVVGFFADRWVNNFLHCVADQLPDAQIDRATSTVTYNGHTTRIETMPLGYSSDALASRDRQLSQDIVDWAADAQLVVHSGRTDPMKNGVRAVQAFVLAMTQNPGLRGTAKLLMRTNPNRLYIAANADYMKRLEDAVDSANKELGAEVVQLLCENDVSGTMASYEHADVLFFNSTIDGQNLSVYEASLLNTNNAPVILSETCGASETLKDVCRIVNPFDLQEQADALRDALMATPEVRRSDFALRYDVAAKYSLDSWIAQQMASILSAGAK